jgi:hypothetical protein
MIRSRLVLALVLSVAVAPALHAQAPRPAPAQQPGQPPDTNAVFDGYVVSDQYRRYLENLFNKQEPAAAKGSCAAMKIVASDAYLMIEPPRFVTKSGSYVINSGKWVAVAQFDRCGTQVTRRALLQAVPGKNEFQVTFLLPGDFRGNLELESEAEGVVIPSLMNAAKCKDNKTFTMLDIRAAGPASAQGWAETWFAQACGAPVSIKVTYTKKAAGFNIVTSDAKGR